jgi:hypothetical protein
VPAEGTPEAEICGGTGVRLAETKRQIVRRPRAKALDRRDRANQLLQADTPIEADSVVAL